MAPDHGNLYRHREQFFCLTLLLDWRTPHPGDRGIWLEPSTIPGCHFVQFGLGGPDLAIDRLA